MHGMYAFALWDEEEQTLFCLRDPFGTKPFYYYETEDGALLYGTTIRGIMEQPGFKKELNEEMLQLYLSLTYVAGENDLFQGCEKADAGTLSDLEGRKTTGSSGTGNRNFIRMRASHLEDWADEIHTTLKNIMPEVKGGRASTAEAFLSGGVDSSYVLAMSDVQKTDSCGYEEPSDLTNPDLQDRQQSFLEERAIQRCVITPEEYFGIVPDVMYNMEQPLGDASAIVFATWMQGDCKAYEDLLFRRRMRMNSSVDTICIEMQNATARI